MSDRRRIALAAAVAAIVIAYVVVRLWSFMAVTPRDFPDTAGYERVAELPLDGRRFWMAWRPFTIPLVYKALGGDARTATSFQWAFSVVAWTILAAVAAASVRSRALRPGVVAALLVASLDDDVLRWDGDLLSESISLSLTALLAAGGLLLAGRFTTPRLLALLATATLWAFARDSSAYALPFLGLLVAALALTGSAPRRWLLVTLAFLLTFMASLATASAGRRWEVPLMNVLVGRIVPEPSRHAFFVERGMPVGPAETRLAESWLGPERRRALADPSVDDLRRWLEGRARRTYVAFLLTHPGFAVGGPLGDIDQLLSPRLDFYSPQGFRSLPMSRLRVGTLATVAVSGGLLATAGVLAVRGRARGSWLVPASAMGLALPLSAVVWHGDTVEISRHAVCLAVQVRLGAWLLLCFVADSWLERRTRPASP